ncbi:MAG: hypothetical protein HC876_19845, partial [Chloroflexaceae bacterium]|nr:hypothetical protein [Chloroflexaceae bacterium]
MSTTLPSPPASAQLLTLLDAATRILQSERAFAERVGDLFGVLHEALQYRDMRLTCWLQSAQRGAVRRQFLSSGPDPLPWDDALMRQTAVSGQLMQRTLPLPVRPRGHTAVLPPGAAEADSQLMYRGAPIVWSERLWGVLEWRTTGGVLKVVRVFDLRADPDERND